jgi:AcrR family transcriptional regulator
MNETSRDIRYRQTEEDLRDAFELLCLKKDPQKITVAEMAERTGVTRSTFYNHYTDMPTLIMRIEDDILDEIFSMLDGCRAEGMDSRKLVRSFFWTIQAFPKAETAFPTYWTR